MNERRRLSMFVDAVSGYQVAGALKAVALKPVQRISEKEFPKVATFAVSDVRKIAPHWLDVQGLVSLGEVMNSKYFWLDLLKQQNPQIQRDSQAILISSSNEKAAESIHESNLKFSARTVALNLLAAAIGRKFGEDIEDSECFLISVQTGFQSAMAMSRIYPKPVTNSQELYERLCELFPVDEPEPQKLDLFTLLVNHNEFYGRKSGNACVAPTLTKKCFRNMEKY